MTDMKMADQIAGIKMQDMKMQDMKLQDMTRIDSILFSFSFFLYCDAHVAAIELCNVIMK